MRIVHWGALCGGLLLPFSTSALETAATVTLLEGEASIIRGTARYALAEGVVLAAGDIVETTEKGLLQVEFPDGTALSIGPRTRMLALALPRSKAGADFYVLQGEFKHAGARQGPGSFRYVTPAFTLGAADSDASVVVAAGEGAVFVETGEARITEPVPKGTTAAAIRVKGGEFYARKPDQKSTVAPKPAPAFIAALPRSFLDPLPSRASRYKDREVNPRPLGEVTYAEVEFWLKAPPDLRRPFFVRFQPRVQDPAFRAALAANVRSHPEWDPILFPEKYKPKPESQAEAPKPRAP